MAIDINFYQATLLSLANFEFYNDAKPESLKLYPSVGNSDPKGITVYYAPFEAVNPNAKVILIGITPGASQMRRSWLAARKASVEGKSIPEALSEIKRVSAFNDEKGQMRPNLFAQLDDWEVPRYLGYKQASSLFEEGWGELQTTSLIPYPTFINSQNYNGKSPTPLVHDYLKSLILERFVTLLKSLSDAFLLPLGVEVSNTLRQLYEMGKISNPCTHGLLHPSPNNTYRVKYLCGRRTEPVPSKTNVASYDQGRKEFKDRYLI